MIRNESHSPKEGHTQTAQDVVDMKLQLRRRKASLIGDEG